MMLVVDPQTRHILGKGYSIMLHPWHCSFVDDGSFQTLAVMNSVILLFMSLSTTDRTNTFSNYKCFFTLFFIFRAIHQQLIMHT